MRFQMAVTSEHVAGFGWVPFSELGESGWREKERRRIAVKPKFADDYVGGLTKPNVENGSVAIQ